MTKQIKFINPSPPPIQEVFKDLKKIYKSGIHTNMGPFEKEFEKQISTYLSKNKKLYTVAVSNATVGLQIAINQLFKTEGYVPIPSFTFAATVQALIWNNLKPIFVDIDKETWTMQPNQKIFSLLKNKKVAGILFCNPFGIPGDIEMWQKIAEDFETSILIDSAAGLGSIYPDGARLGTKGHAEVLSLHITKPFGVGEGGLITTYNKKLSKRLQMAKNFGFDQKHKSQLLGTNAKMPEYSSIVGLHTLKYFNKKINQKKKLINYYKKSLKKSIKTNPNIEKSSAQFLPVIFKSPKLRESAEMGLKKNKIEYRKYYYPPLHEHPLFKKIKRSTELKNTKYITDRILALPLHLNLSTADVKLIVETINSSVHSK